jgi:tetratricopeptide (TPR) repeat protein
MRYVKILVGALFGVWVSLGYQNAKAASPFPESITAMQYLYHFQFSDADSLISQLEKEYPEHFLPHFVRANYFWWQIVSNSDQQQYKEQYYEALKEAEKFLLPLTDIVDPDDNNLFFMINTLAFKARLDVMKGDYFKSLGHLNRSVRLIEYSLGRESQHFPLYLTSGLYKYLADYGKSRYPFLALYTLIYPSGNREVGLEYLEKAAMGSDTMVKVEAHYFLMRIFMEPENNHEKALEHAQWLKDQYPANLIFRYYHKTILEEVGQPDLVAELKKAFSDSLRNNDQLSTEQKAYFEMLW